MLRTMLLSIGLLGISGLIPVQAQDLSAEDLQMLTFHLGGGLSVPLNPAARYVGVNGNAGTGVGANFDKQNSIEGDFLWSGLSPITPLVRPTNVPFGSVNVYALTGEYRFHIDSFAETPFGAYVIGGGGWYYRNTSISKNYIVPPATICQPIFNWWGFACNAGGLVSSTSVSHGTSSGGLNAGIGFTIKVGDQGWKFFAEARYHYAWSQFLPTTFVPVTFGFRFN